MPREWQKRFSVAVSRVAAVCLSLYIRVTHTSYAIIANPAVIAARKCSYASGNSPAFAARSPRQKDRRALLCTF